MEFSVVFEDGAWVFRVTSTGDGPTYIEEFEITDFDEACAAAVELIEEIAREDDDFDGEMLEELEPRDVH